MAKGICGKRCKSCQYRMCFLNPPHYIACNYFGITLQRRPCEAGEGCTVYKKGRALTDKKPVAVINPKVEITCGICGTKLMANPKKKYCDSCMRQREILRLQAYREEKRAERAATELAKEKVCILCGKVYHSERANTELCPECKGLSKHTRKKMKTAKEQGV